jgi:hypothetical protein
MSKILLSNNVTTKTLTVGDSAWSPAPVYYGEDLTFALALKRTVDGEEVDWYPTVTGLQAAIGAIDERPLGGEFKVKVGAGAVSAANTTGYLKWNASAKEWATEFNGLSVLTPHGAAEVWTVDGSFFLKLADGAHVELTVVRNRLWPITFGRVLSYQRDGAWVHEVRFQQAPVAFTSAHERVLPPPPTIARVQDGGAEGETTWNEIQALSVPPEFRGSYQIRRGFIRGTQLSRADGVDQIAGSIVELGSFKVTNPTANTANIEFVDDDGGQVQDLLEVVVFNAPPGDLTFTLTLDRPELLTVLRKRAEITLPMHCRLTVDNEDGDGVRKVLAFSVPVTIRRPLVWDDMEEVQEIDWLRPPSPQDYRGYDPSTVITGTGQFYPTLLGDGEATEFTITHGLGTSLIANVEVSDRETGELLVRGTDYRVRIENDNQVTFYGFAETPTLEQYQAVIFAAGPQSAFVAGLTVNMSQVNGLELWMEGMEGRVTALEDLAPTNPLALTDGTGEAIVIPIPARREVWYGRLPRGFVVPGSQEWEKTSWPHAPALIPAIHTETVTELEAIADLADATTHQGEVWKNVAGEDLELDGGDGIRPATVLADGFFGSDGRAWYPLTKRGETTSYFPTQMEREIFMFALQDGMLRAGTTLEITGALVMRLLAATTWAQAVLVVELGTISSDSTPDPTEQNLEAIEWDEADPVLKHRVVLSNMVGADHSFGVRIIRAKDGTTYTSSGMRYKVWTAATKVPATNVFAVRARFRDLDTRDSEWNERGWAAYEFTGQGHIY